MSVSSGSTNSLLALSLAVNLVLLKYDRKSDSTHNHNDSTAQTPKAVLTDLATLNLERELMSFQQQGIQNACWNKE
ncbi:hypothetical protein BDBG_17382 [Blastomyces gilchristii SLH14081]|uniref:Uncharacterized protein n=1 Tax=Blastomyces gilchristii (strain SLH14081) TaxID=559298 RepID=A0A179UTT7_BLAGS|nr:uncharacterized protein BDBG_17382 [Blastomyces gilchristii SLH14081]OAT10588.1 hypothetical protein BDBG_17382 [Blastomyces gilchristii SLH14081]